MDSDRGLQERSEWSGRGKRVVVDAACIPFLNVAVFYLLDLGMNAFCQSFCLEIDQNRIE